MLTNLWRCFETTGDINHYLCFKEYEEARSSIISLDEVDDRCGIAQDRTKKP